MSVLVLSALLPRSKMRTQMRMLHGRRCPWRVRAGGGLRVCPIVRRGQVEATRSMCRSLGPIKRPSRRPDRKSYLRSALRDSSANRLGSRFWGLEALVVLGRGEVPVVQEAETVGHAEPTANRCEERRNRVRADRDLVVGLQEQVRLFPGKNLVQI